MSKLFEPTAINGMPIRNRMLRSATWEGMCEPDGRPTEKLRRCYLDLARGGIGLIITGYAFVRPEGKQLPGKMGIHTDRFEADFRRLTEAVHSADASVAIQLVHAGGQTIARTAGRQPLAPSAVQVDQYKELPAEMTARQIADVIDAFGQGAERARQWGFDGIQLHAAHGYLINQFLSPLTNRRRDDYGGSLDNRCRFLMAVYENVRRAVGEDFPVMAKLNGSDNLPGGLDVQDALYAARKLDAAGIDAIEISSGTPGSGKKGPIRDRITKPEREAYNLSLAGHFKAEVACPVMVVGGMRSYGTAEKAVEQDGLDYVSFCRPLIREPDLAARWQKGDRRPAACISCSGCFKPGLNEGGIYCIVEKRRSEAGKS